MKKALMMAHVASMIDLFNMNNIHILQEMGYQVDVACNFESGSVTSSERVTEFKQELKSLGIRYYHVPIPRKLTSVKSIIKSYYIMKNLVEDNHYDIVHCQSPIGGVITRLACKMVRKCGTKVIYVAHGFHFYKGASIFKWLLYYPIEKICAKYTDCIITINKEDYKLVKRKYKKVKQINYLPGAGIDVQKIEKKHVDILAKRAELNIPADAIIIVSVGELNKNKNQEVIIRALKMLDNKKIHYIICGQGSRKEYITDLTQQFHMEGNVHLLGYRDDIIEILKASNVFAFPSIREGLSVSLMEAMAAGLPVICSKIRGNVELIKEDSGGYLFDPTDIEEVKRSIEKVINFNNSLNLGQFNRQIVKQYDSKIVDDIMKNIYKTI